jgi:sugar/nucleoside kinase (ribokinase family)
MTPPSRIRPKLLVAGICGIDKNITPKGRKTVLGGTAFHASIAASHFTQVALVTGVGRDFPAKHLSFLQERGINTSGVMFYPGKTKLRVNKYNDKFELVSSYKTGIIYPTAMELKPQLKPIKYVFIGALNPKLQLNILKQMPGVKEAGIDTKLNVIRSKKDELLEAIRLSSMLFLNKEEAMLLSGSSNLHTLPEKLARLGPRTIVIKLDKDGAEMYRDGLFIKAPAIANKVVDPTGAGDSFAGAFMGYLAAKGSSSVRDYMNAFIAGNVIASFNVERFGSERLIDLNGREIGERSEYLKSIVLKQAKF